MSAPGVTLFVTIENLSLSLKPFATRTYAVEVSFGAKWVRTVAGLLVTWLTLK